MASLSTGSDGLQAIYIKTSKGRRALYLGRVPKK